MNLLEKLFYPIFLIAFTLSMLHLFFKFAEYVERNGL